MINTVEDRPAIDQEMLEQFAGQWVALRDGHVVAAAATLKELRRNPDVRRADAVYVVPEHPSYFF